ncbi:MAG: FMN-binding protein [Clostridia bacterium]|nr:FMN-binding protein [Clostridia bacterium]
MTKSKKLIAFLFTLCICISLAACSSGNEPVNYADGTYTGRSSDFKEDETGNGSGYGQAELIIRDNQIVSCTFTLFELDGTLKDESYGADLSKENRLKAQKAVQAAAKYAEQLVNEGTLDGVDEISGATISYNEFVEAVNDALGKAAANN